MDNGTLISCLLIACFFMIGHDKAYAGRKGKPGGHKSTLSGGYKPYKGGSAIDGDTFRYKGERYRIQQYNAPELGKSGSSKATQELQQKLDSGNYEWKPVARDVYGRPIVKERKK